MKTIIYLPLLFFLTLCLDGCIGTDEVLTPAKIEITPRPSSLVEKASIQLKYKYTDSQGKSGTPAVKWSSSNTNIATVSPTGLLTAVSEGDVSIYVKVASDTTVKDRLPIQVNAVPQKPTPAPTTGQEKITIMDMMTTLPVGVSFPLQYTYLNAMGSKDTTAPVVWTSSDRTKATVNNRTGVVTAVAAGTTTITVAVSGKPNIKDELSLTVVGMNNNNATEGRGTIIANSAGRGYGLQGGSFTISNMQGGGVKLNLNISARSGGASAPDFVIYLTNSPEDNIRRNKDHLVVAELPSTPVRGALSYTVKPANRNITVMTYSHVTFWCRGANIYFGGGRINYN